MDNIKKQYQIVVARYNEDINWLLPFKDITIIYNKGKNSADLSKFEVINLPNVGRESHTYLYHIVNNYENLANKTIFFQGKITDHKVLDIEDYFGKDDFIAKFNKFEINALKKRIEHFGKYQKDLSKGLMKKCNYTPYEWLLYVIGINLININENTKIVWGANFAISKDIILSKPKVFYENILRHIDYHSNPEEGHYLERSWYIIFNNIYIPKNKIGYTFINQPIISINKYNSLINSEYKEIHLWTNINANSEVGLTHKINYTPNNNKYLTINPLIENNDNNNQFTLSIKGNNDAHIIIDFQNSETKYEIVLGAWNNSRSIVRDYTKNIIISSYEKPTLNNNQFIKFTFTISDKIIVQNDNEILFDILLPSENNVIKNIKIKSYYDSSLFWDYKMNDNDIEDNKIKLYLCTSVDENISLFYKNYYLNYYVEKIENV
jgi:hypothetical protein